MSKNLSNKLLILVVSVIAVPVIIESFFLSSMAIIKTGGDQEIAQKFTEYLNNKDYWQASHLMCLGSSGLSRRLNVDTDILSAKKTEKFAYVLSPREIGNQTVNLKIYPSNQAPEKFGYSFGIIKSSVPILSPCIITQAG